MKLTLSLALLCSTACSQSPQNLTWTPVRDFMDLHGQQVRPMPQILTLPQVASNFFDWACGNAVLKVSDPLAATETDRVDQVSGLAFVGTFIGVETTPGRNLFATAFFNENRCYAENGLGASDAPGSNGREYGFFLASSDNSIWAYWGTKENFDTVQVQVRLDETTNERAGSGPKPGFMYRFEIRPTVDCNFSIDVYSPGEPRRPVYRATVPQDGDRRTATNSADTIRPISGADNAFCGAIARDTGYVSLNVNPSGSAVAASDELGLFVSAAWVLR